ncbi:Putative glucanase GlgE [Mycobacterium tuberculosis]|nr:Putative glucanase GlgE [Mycobacterium tuberculosis]
MVLAVVNLNPHHPREATVHLDLPALGLPDDPHHPHTVTDQLNGATYTWTQANYVYLDPHTNPAHILTFRSSES